MQVIQDEKEVIAHLEVLAKLMDSQFKIPGTNIRFGLDSLIGLVPGIGDFSTFLVSGYMVAVLAQNGASGFVLARMVLNIVLDAFLGSIPLLGDVFDVAFRANQRNIALAREHYMEGRHSGSAWKLIVPLLVVALLLVAAIAWAGYEVVAWLFHQAQHAWQ
jgi:hypothetical protein